MPTKSNALFIWSPVGACMGIIYLASSIPGKNIPPLFPMQDYAYHSIVYLLLGFSFIRAIRYSFGVSHSQAILTAIIFCVIYGLLDEWHQSFVPNRSVSGRDLFIDGIGSAIGSLVYQWRK